MGRRLRLLFRHGGLIGEAFAAVLRVRFDLLVRRKSHVLPLLRRQARAAPGSSAGGDRGPRSEDMQPRPPLPVEVAAPVWAVRHAARLVPGASCLTQALAGQMLLARRGTEAVVRIGVRRGLNGAFEAHAWLVHEGRTLLGGAYEPGPDFVPISDLSPSER